ncbi:MAG: response regulator [Halothece sp.]
MDAETQARQDFLEEAIEYCDQLESALLGMAEAGVDLQKFDEAARAAHSMKGGGAMMGFNALSRMAHSLEDYLKIIQARLQELAIDTELETLLLRSVDCLRAIGQEYRAGKEPQQKWLEQQTRAIFDPLKERLGELTEADETALLSKEEDSDVAALLFGSGVEECLQRLKSQLEILFLGEIPQELKNTADELADFGRMIECERFVNFCQSVKQELENLSENEVKSFAQSAIAQWERSQALIQLGRYENLPQTVDTSDVTAEEENWDDLEIPDLDEFEDFEEFSTDLEIPSEPEAREEETLSVTEEAEPIAVPANLEETPVETKPEETTVRVSVNQLSRINTLFSRLILEREMLNSRVKQLEEFVSLSKSRTQQLETANRQLRKWYDQLNAEGATVSNQLQTANLSNNGDFDTLEMDRYSDLHLLFQEQIETIVQLQEVTSDIEVSSRDVKQAMGELNYTTSDLQRDITRVQTRPFIEAVRSFRRVVRDLSVQYNKPVAIEIQGENTLIDRAAMEALSAPLNHLFRNAFDHGIEDTETRVARGKPKQGKITLRAINQGNQSTVTISDDGGGINAEKIKAKLQEAGATPEDIAQLSEQDILQAIFEPGFSTAEQVTELSGRGVGMDVVRTNLDKIRGDIHVDTKLGEGTTFTITFPLSLSIARVVIVESEGLVFAIPVEAVKAFARWDHSQQESGTLNWNGMEVSVVSLKPWSKFNRPRKTFEMSGAPTLDRPTALIVNDHGTFKGLRVDRFWQEQEVALRSVDSPIPLPPGVTGSTVLGDGRPIPLVDPIPLLAWLQQPTSAEGSQALENNKQTQTDNTILIIDDSIHVRRYLAMALEKAGYQVEQAKDGQEAVDKIKSGLPVQAAICDLEMPRLDGYGVLSEIKEDPNYKHLPIAMLTSRGNEKHRQLAMKLGAFAYFSKPYNEQELFSTLQNMVNK